MFFLAQKTLRPRTTTTSPVYITVGNDLILNADYGYDGTQRVAVVWTKDNSLLVRISADTNAVIQRNGRATIMGKASLVLKNVTVKDNGMFVVRLLADDATTPLPLKFVVIVLSRSHRKSPT